MMLAPMGVVVRKEKLSSYTERAIRATEAGKLIPPIVYLPRLLRSKSTLVTTDMASEFAHRVEAPEVDIEARTVRIKEADPLGFLIAVMNGQPIPEFRVTRTGNIELFYAVPKMHERLRAAEYMSGVGKRGPKLKRDLDEADDTQDHDTLIERAAAHAD